MLDLRTLIVICMSITTMAVVIAVAIGVTEAAIGATEAAIGVPAVMMAHIMATMILM